MSRDLKEGHTKCWWPSLHIMKPEISLRRGPDHGTSLDRKWRAVESEIPAVLALPKMSLCTRASSQQPRGRTLPTDAKRGRSRGSGGVGGGKRPQTTSARPYAPLRLWRALVSSCVERGGDQLLSPLPVRSVSPEPWNLPAPLRCTPVPLGAAPPRVQGFPAPGRYSPRWGPGISPRLGVSRAAFGRYPSG